MRKPVSGFPSGGVDAVSHGEMADFILPPETTDTGRRVTSLFCPIRWVFHSQPTSARD